MKKFPSFENSMDLIVYSTTSLTHKKSLLKREGIFLLQN